MFHLLEKGNDEISEMKDMEIKLKTSRILGQNTQ